jgi:signal transduction histidine kinase/CHASE2 domain-containing sensor protein
MVVAWQAPGLERYARDWLMRLRGPVPVSNEIAIVAIDDSSIAKLGRFPWTRSVMARAVDAIAAQQPKAIALDVLFSDPTTPDDDQALAAAIGRARTVIVGAELADGGVYGGEARWLMPLPLLAAQAAATGHVNVGAESDGSARQVLVEQSDDAGNALRAIPVETFRIGNRIPAQAIVEGPNEFVIGPRAIPVEASGNAVRGNARLRRATRMAIDYAGPAGAFAAQQYSIAELLEGKTAPGALRGKYVLVGSTAASLGERFASPFTHYADAQGNQHGASIPGVEVLANALNTLVRGRFYSEMPELVAFVWTALWAWLMLALLSFAQGRRGVLMHLAAVVLGLGFLLAGAYLCFTQLLVFSPLVASLAAFGSAGLAGLAERSVKASAELDRGIQRVLESLRGFGEGPSANATAESIVRLTGVTAALLFRSGRLPGAFGYPEPGPEGMPGEDKAPAGMRLTKILLGNEDVLILGHPVSNPPSRQTIRLAEALARAGFDDLKDAEETPRGFLPEGLEEKTESIVRLNDRISRQAEFFHSSMRAVEDGLLIAGPDGRIRFANPRAGAILDLRPEILIGRDLFEVLGPAAAVVLHAGDLLETLILNRQVAERELNLRSHRYTLRLAPVVRGADSADPVIGIVASLADVTRQHELAQTRSDVVTLVSHEMRTPLTAIQGMTELLANYEIEPLRRKEMTLAINDEVKRLARMIGDYLDIAKLEMGKTALRRGPVRVESVVERSLLLFEPLAQEKSIHLLRSFDHDLRPILGDADLLSRVFGNLISNAVKYSAPGTDISVSIRGGDGEVVVEVEDHGYGIPPEDVERIFEKFYRVPRLQDADVPGTGLGLTFVREIVELHGGTVSVRSAPGAGSVFRVCLPIQEK